MHFSIAKCYCSDRDSYPCTLGHLPCNLTNWANSPTPGKILKLSSSTQYIKTKQFKGREKIYLITYHKQHFITSQPLSHLISTQVSQTRASYIMYHTLYTSMYIWCITYYTIINTRVTYTWIGGVPPPLPTTCWVTLGRAPPHDTLCRRVCIYICILWCYVLCNHEWSITFIIHVNNYIHDIYVSIPFNFPNLWFILI